MDKHDFETSGRTLRWYEWLAFLLLFFLAAGVRAESVYKCTDAGGGVAYQTQACASAQREVMVAIAPAPAHAPSPTYAAHQDVEKHAARRGRGNAALTHRGASSTPQSYECRTADGQVFYRHASCPHSVAAQAGSTKGHGRSGAQSVSVSGHRVAREEACTQMRRAGAAGRSGREHDEDVSTYDKNLGRDPCR
ncbi:MAG: DUF4124 domain-containing protein [Rudaea sp.]